MSAEIFDVIIPATGESVKEGDIARWFKETGDFVKMDEALLELETEKASLEISAEADGKLTIVEPEGATVQVGQKVGYIEAINADEAAKKIDVATEKKTLKKTEPIRTEAADKKGDTADENGNDPNGGTVGLPSPAARKLLVENKVSAQDVRGTGKGGRITKADVLAFIEERDRQEAILSSKKKFMDFYGSDAPVVSPDETITLFRRPETHEMPQDILPSESVPPLPTPVITESVAPEDDAPSAQIKAHSPGDQVSEPGFERTTRREKLTRMRKTISRRMIEAQQSAAMLTTFNEVDMSAIIGIRRQYKEKFKEIHEVGLGFMSFFTQAACRALLQMPVINAQMESEHIVYQDYCDIGIAVSTPKGLIVPVIRNAETMGLHEIEREIVNLANKAKIGQISLDDLTGGTFTITNGGVFGSMLSTPILNRPQSAIMGMHNIVERAVVRDGEIVIRPIMYLALTYDHRLIDGSDAVRFLVKVKELCEDPITLMLNL